MPVFYKGVAAGTHLSKQDFRLTGLIARAHGTYPTNRALTAHIRHGTTTSCYVSLTRSYGVAEAYAFSGIVPPSQADPGYVYEVDLPDPLPQGLSLIDPVEAIAQANANPLAAYSYHHDGDQKFLLGIVDPIQFGFHLAAAVKTPPNSGATGRPGHLSPELEVLVRALRDAELLAVGNIPGACFVNRFAIY